MNQQQVHIIINNTQGDAVLVNSFPCYECGTKTRTKTSQNTVNDKPFIHGLQFGKCPQCSAFHMIASARSTSECDDLIPIVQSFAESLKGQK